MSATPHGVAAADIEAALREALAPASLLAFLALVTLAIKSVIEWRLHQQHSASEQV